MMPAMYAIFKRKLREERSLLIRSLQNTPNRAQSSNLLKLYLFHVDVQSRGKGSKSERNKVCSFLISCQFG